MREQGRKRAVADELPGALIWFVGLVGRIEWERRRTPTTQPARRRAADGPDLRAARRRSPPSARRLKREPPAGPPAAVGDQPQPPRAPRALALAHDRQGRRRDLPVQPHCRTLCWAVLDSGIDATHPRVRRRDATSRCEPRTAPPRRLARPRDLRLHPAARAPRRHGRRPRTRSATPATSRATRSRRGCAAGAPSTGRCCRQLHRRPVDGRPTHEHGTHVAGILAADWRQEDPRRAPTTTCAASARTSSSTTCACSTTTASGDEFAILAALQFVRWLNANAAAPVVHGVNLCLSLDHEVGAFACGRTPVCDECERLLGSGTVVVAAAGNEGRAFFSMRVRHGGGLPPDLDHRPRQRQRRDHGRRDAPPPAPHLRRLVLLQPRADRRRPRQARPRRARREDHRAGAEPRAQEPRRHEHGRAARLRRRGAADGAPSRADRLAARGQAGAVRDRHRPRPRALLPGRAASSTPCARSSRCEAGDLLARGAAGVLRRLAARCTSARQARASSTAARSGTWQTSLHPRLEQLRAARAPTAAAAHRPRDGQPHRRRPHPRPDRLRRRDGRARRRPPAPALRASAALWHNAFDDIARQPMPRGALRDAPPGRWCRSVGQGRELRDQAIRLGWPRNQPFDGLVRRARGRRLRRRHADRRLARRRRALDDLARGVGRVAQPTIRRRSPGRRLRRPLALQPLEHRRARRGGRQADAAVRRRARRQRARRAREAGKLRGRRHAPLDILKLPHHGSIRNVDHDFFERLPAAPLRDLGQRARRQPGVGDARGDRRRRAATTTYEIHLTNHDGQNDIAQRLDAFTAARPGHARSSFRDEAALALRIDLDDPLP